MKTVKFEYYQRDIKQLVKDIAFRLLFSTLFLASFVWQISTLIITGINGSVTFLQIIVSIISLLCSLLLCVTTMTFAFKDFRIISAIRMNGKCVSKVAILFSTEKKGFLKLYGLLTQFLTLVTSLVLVACITYSILEVAYFSTISFFMPFLLTICIAGYNSIYHIKDEITTQKTVQKQQPLY